jgi:anti-sigma regulatory factor (Ser/Thr protein kinase)
VETVLNTYGAQLLFDLQDVSSIAVVRRAGARLARELNFSEVRTGQLALVITEASTNIIKHAGEGQILLRTIGDDERSGIEIIALDKGPGIGDMDWHAEDGNSTAGTYGIGLGALRRLSQRCEIYSAADKGTALWMVVWAGDEEPLNLPELADWEIGAICVPIKGEEISGDDWAVFADGELITLIVADGLGHGPDAAIAANSAIEVCANCAGLPASVIMQRAHAALHGTRGAAVAISQIDSESGTLGFTGVGNISVCIQRGEGNRHLLSHNGIVGSNVRKIQEFSESWARDALLIAHSDGISTRWDISNYPGLEHCHAALIAAVIYRDFSRGRDDATVVVMREA